MKTKEISKEKLKEAVNNIMRFETEYLLNETVRALSNGYSVIVDGLTYLGNGRHEKRTKVKRYKYKMIVPIMDDSGNLYSTDLFEASKNGFGVENAVNGKYAIYICTRQLVVGIVNVIDTEYGIERFEFGYKEDKYGHNKIAVI